MKPLLALLLVTSYLLLATPSFAQNPGFNVASVYQITDDKSQNGDIIISNGEKGLTRTNVAYDARIFGVLDEKPLLVLEEASGSGKPVIRAGDVLVNVSDYNDNIKKGDYVTSSPVLGRGMKAKQSGYVLGIALENINYSGSNQTVENRQVKLGTVRVALRIEYAELTTAKNNIRLLNDLNAAFFRNIQDPEKFTNTIRFIIAGLVALLAFGIGFFWVSRSISKAVEAIGRNPLAKQSIYISVAFQIGLTVIGGIVTVVIVFLLVRF